MPDYSFIAQPKTSEAIQTLGSLVNTAGALQNLQRGNVALQQERALLQPNIERGQAEARRAQTGAATAQWQLDEAQAQKAYEIAAGVSQDPAVAAGDSKGSINALMHAEEQMRALKIPEDKIRVQLGPLYTVAAHQPQALRQMLDNIVRGGAGVQAQQGVINAPLSPISTETGTRFVQTQPGAANAVQPTGAAAPQPTVIPRGVAPTSTEQPGTDALGRPIIQKRDQAGAITYAPPPGSNYRPLMTLPAGETPETAKSLFDLRDKAQTAAASVPLQHFNNGQIMQLAPDAFTGTGSQKLAEVLSAVGLQKFAPGTDAAAKTAQLIHFSKQQAVNNAAAQGANTDAARALVEQAVLPGFSPEKALKAITKINDAFATGVDAFNRGLQAAIKNPANQKDIFIARDFQNAWTRYFDPNVMRLINANGNQAELNAIAKELGPDRMKALLPKYKALKMLSAGEIPPQ